MLDPGLVARRPDSCAQEAQTSPSGSRVPRRGNFWSSEYSQICRDQLMVAWTHSRAKESLPRRSGTPVAFPGSWVSPQQQCVLWTEDSQSPEASDRGDSTACLCQREQSLWLQDRGQSLK